MEIKKSNPFSCSECVLVLDLTSSYARPPGFSLVLLFFCVCYAHSQTNKVSKSIICFRRCTYNSWVSEADAGRWSECAEKPVPWSRILGAYQRSYLHRSTFSKTKFTAVINSNLQALLRPSDNPSHGYLCVHRKDGGVPKEDRKEEKSTENW